MTGMEFMQKIAEQGAKGRNLQVAYSGENIIRGTAHSIASFCEDLFAVFVATGAKDPNLNYLVDKAISVQLPARARAVSFRPDLAIIDEGVLTHYFDLKTNMGWNRNFVDYLSEKNEFLRALRAKDAWIRYGKDIVQGIKISPELIYQMVIVFGWNINQEQLGSNLLQAQHLDCVKVHVLAPYQATTKTCEVDQVAFDTILKTINK